MSLKTRLIEDINKVSKDSQVIHMRPQADYQEVGDEATWTIAKTAAEKAKSKTPSTLWPLFKLLIKYSKQNKHYNWFWILK